MTNNIHIISILTFSSCLYDDNLSMQVIFKEFYSEWGYSVPFLDYTLVRRPGNEAKIDYVG
jgi:hypothetical protein